MSSLAAARADNFYYPPEYRPEHGSLNKFRGSHPLGDRAKKIHEGILVIRFEMPYKSFCTKCNEVIAKGVRFNAEKRTVGQYFSTKILEFSMKCCFCDNIFKIQTDPKNCDYVPTAGLHRKVENFRAEDAQTFEFRSVEERQEIEKDPMLKLETTIEDVNKAKSSYNQLEALLDLQNSRNSSDTQYSLNSNARKRFRELKKEEMEKERERNKQTNFVIPLVSENLDDIEESQTIDYVTHGSRLKRRIRQRVLEHSSIFQSRKEVRTPPTPKIASPRIVPSSVHKALSVVIRPKQQLPPPVVERSQDRRARLHGHLERLRATNRNAIKASR